MTFKEATDRAQALGLTADAIAAHLGVKPQTYRVMRLSGEHGRRPPAESDNSQRERRYVFQRIPAYGPEQQTLLMLLGSLLDNSKSRWMHQRRQQAQQDAA